MQNLMVLGAGVCQLPLIQAAKQMGFHTVAVSIPGPYPGFSAADESAEIDLCDIPAVISLARQKSICGAVTTALDCALPTLAALSEALGLPGPGARTALLSNDKLLMKQAFLKSGVPSAEYRSVFSTAEALQGAENLGWPVVVKTRRGNGSRGVRKAGHAEELLGILKYFAPEDGLVLERFVTGYSEIGVDGLVQNGQIICLLPHEKLTRNNGHVDVPIGHIFPYEADERTLSAVRSASEKAVRALEMDNCAFNMDLFAGNGNALVIEATARCGATGIPEAASLHIGQSWFEAMIRIACGIPMPFSGSEGFWSASRLLLSDTDGTAVGVAFPRDEDVTVLPDAAPPYSVHRFTSCADRAGLVLVRKSSRRELLSALNALNCESILTVCPLEEEANR